MKRKILAALVLVLLLTMQAAGAEEQIESDATDLYTVYMPFVVNAEKIILGTAINQGSMYNLDYMEIVDKYQRIAPENAGIYFFVQLYG
jgi:uncharacterized membrane protein